MKPILTRADEGHEMPTVDGVMTGKISSRGTGGQFFINHSRIRPGGGPPPHVHTHEDEIFYVLAGTFEFLVGDSIVTVGPGDVLFAPRDVPHTFRNVGETEGEFFGVATGGNFEAFYTKYSAATSVPGFDPEDVRAIAEDHGIRFVQPAP